MSVTIGHTLSCDCGYTCSPQRHRWRAGYLLEQHQNGVACPLGPNYEPPASRKGTRRNKRHYGPDTIPDDCTVLTGECECRDCTAAANEPGSPWQLTDGQWVNDGGVQRWVPC